MNDDDFINASDFDKPSEKSTTSERHLLCLLVTLNQMVKMKN